MDLLEEGGIFEADLLQLSAFSIATARDRCNTTSDSTGSLGGDAYYLGDAWLHGQLQESHHSAIADIFPQAGPLSRGTSSQPEFVRHFDEIQTI